MQRARALGIAVRFAAGHALLLALGAGALVALGWSLPIVVERGGEMLGGLLLSCWVALGSGASAPDGSTATRMRSSTSNWHLHIGRQDRHPLPSAHSHLPTILGAAFAVSSLRALTLLAPFGDDGPRHRSRRCSC